MRSFLFFVLFSAALPAMAQEPDKKVTQRIKVGPDHHHFVYEDGKPFFWLGDTGWELFHRLNEEEMLRYFSTRSAQGFNVIQAVALAELDGLHVPNAYGELPIENDNPLKPVEAYFQRLDWAIDKAAEYGLYIGLLPTWGDKIFKNNWGVGPEIFNIDNARPYGAWLGDRYKNKKNIIWILGGDRLPRNQQDIDIWLEMARGITEATGLAADPMISYHPQPSASSSSSPWFHHYDWLDFNMLQTGHCRDVNVWDKVYSDYKLSPAKPTVNGEPVYEEHPVCFNAKELGYTNAYDVRKAVYLSTFAGSAGVTYGCHAVWQFYAPGRKGINGPLKSWQESLTLPAAGQMQYLKKLTGLYSILNATPYQQILTDTLDGTNRIQALSAGKNILVYTASGRAVKINPAMVSSASIENASWYNPRTGNKQNIRRKTIMKLAFQPPTNGEGEDWVLIIQLR